MNRAFNLGHYISNRAYKNTIKKPDMYKLLDNREDLLNSLITKKIKDELDEYNTCNYLEKTLMQEK